MLGRSGKFADAGICVRLVLAAVLVLIAGTANAVVVAEPPAANRPAALSTAERTTPLKERNRLWQEAERLQAQGKLGEAIVVVRQILAIERQLFGNANEEIAQSLDWLARAHVQRDELNAARTEWQELSAIRTKLYGEKDWRAADARRKVRDLEIRSRLTVQERRELVVAEQANSRVVALYRTGDFRQAIRFAEQAVKIRRRLLGDQHPDTATSLDNLAQLYDSMGDYSKAESLVRAALEIYKKVLGDSHPDTATSLNNLAALYRTLGDYARAEPLYRQALEIDKRVLGISHPSTATSLENLALLYCSLGDYSKAEPLYRQALEIHKQVLGEQHPSTATSLSNLAGLYESLGDYTKAEPLYRQALEIHKQVLGEQHPSTATSLNNLAGLYESLRDYAKAEPLYRQALEIDKKALGDTHPAYAMQLNNLGWLYQSTGDYAKAEPLYRQALEIRQKVLGEKHRDTAESLSNLAGLYDSLGDYAKAEPLCRQALEISLGGLSRTFGILSERQQLALESISQWSRDRYLSIVTHGNIPDASVYAYVLESKGAVTVRQFLVRLERRRPDLKRSFDELQTVGTQLANLSLAGADPNDPKVRVRKIEALTEQKETLEVQLAAQYQEFAQTRDAARLSRDVQLRKLQTAIPPRTALVDVLEYTHSAPPAGTKGPLKFERRLVAFVVHNAAEHKGAVIRIELGPTREVTRAVEGWRLVAVDPDVPQSNGLEFLQKLRALVWDKLEPHLVGADTILLSPDGPLCRFPLGALPGSKPDSYLIEERTIAVIPLPRMLPQLVTSAKGDRSAGRAESLLLIGDVEYGGSPGEAGTLASRSTPRAQWLHSFRKLEHSATEVAAIQLSFTRHFKKGTVELLLGGEAIESAFRQQAPSHRWLHLATHGFYDPPGLAELRRAQVGHEKGDRTHGLFERDGIAVYNPGLLSGLALAGANRQTVNPGEDDGILTALEVSALDLAGVELAVLSACETGLGSAAGETTGGEGLLGLQRAFQLAGAKTVIAGLWRVPDRETMLLMQRFYQNLWDKKLPKAQALREAQIWLIRDGKPRRGLDISDENSLPSKRLLPKYWAAFSISGDWR